MISFDVGRSWRCGYVLGCQLSNANSDGYSNGFREFLSNLYILMDVIHIAIGNSYVGLGSKTVKVLYSQPLLGDCKPCLQ